MSANHRGEAERILNGVLNESDYPGFDEGEGGEKLVLAALVHAVLADRQDARSDISSLRHAIHTYRFALIRQVAEGLALSEGDEAHEHALGLAKYLDSVGLNVDAEVDAYIEGIGWGDSRDAWLCPTARKAKWMAELPIPWATGTDPWADKPAD